MPAININGGGGAGGGGGSLEAAIAALTAAVNRNTAAQGGGGAGGGGGFPAGAGAGGKRTPPIFGTKGQRADARWLDADHNARNQFQRRQFERSERDFVRAQKESYKFTVDNEEKKYKFRQASRAREERDIKKSEREARREGEASDRWTTQNENSKYRFKVNTARKEEREDKRQRAARDRDIKARQAQDKRDHEAENRWIIANSNQIWRNQQAALKRASVSPRSGRTPEEIRAAFDYRTMRADADHMNRQHDRANRPESGGGGGGKRGGSGGAWDSWVGSTPNKQFSPNGLSGLFNGLISNSVIGTGIAGAMAAAALPTMLASITRGIMNLAEPAFDLRSSTAAMGRGGGFNSRLLQEAIHPASGSAPEWMQQFGYTPMTAKSTLENIGLNLDEVDGPAALKSIGNARYMPGMGMSHDELTQGFGQGTRLGMLNPRNEESREAFWRQFQKNSIIAQTYSLNHASSQQAIISMLARSAGAGASVMAGQEMGDFWARGVAGGAPGARTGDLLASAAAGMDAQAAKAGPGGSPAFNFAMQTYFKGGMPSSEGALATFIDRHESGAFGKLKENNPSLVADYLAAVAAGNTPYAMGLMGQMLIGHPKLIQDIAGSAGSYGPGYMSAGNRANAAGITPGEQRAVDGRTPYASGIDQSSATTNEVSRQAHDYFISKGWSEAQTAGILGYISTESGFDPGSFNPKGGGQGAMGLGQWRGERIDRFREQYGIDPRYAPVAKQLEYIDWELRNTENSTGNQLANTRTPYAAGALMRTGYGRGAPVGSRLLANQASAGGDEAVRQANAFNNIDSAENRARGKSGRIEQKGADTMAEFAFKLGGDAGDVITRVSEGIGGAVKAVLDFTTALSNAAERLRNWNPLPDAKAGPPHVMTGAASTPGLAGARLGPIPYLPPPTHDPSTM